MRLVPRLNIAQKLPFALAGAALLASAIVGIGAYLIAANTVTALTEDKLATLAAERAHVLSSVWTDMRDDLLITAASGNTASALANLVIGWDNIGQDQTAVLQDAYITKNPNGEEERDLVAFRRRAGRAHAPPG